MQSSRSMHATQPPWTTSDRLVQRSRDARFRLKRASVRHSTLRLHTRLAETEPHWNLGRPPTGRNPALEHQPPVCKPPSHRFPAKPGPMWYSPAVLSAKTEHQSSTTSCRTPVYLQGFPPME